MTRPDLLLLLELRRIGVVVGPQIRFRDLDRGSYQRRLHQKVVDDPSLSYVVVGPMTLEVALDLGGLDFD